MAANLKKLLDMKLEAYKSESTELENLLQADPINPEDIQDTLEIAIGKVESCYEVQLKLIEAYAKADDKVNFLLEESQLAKLQRSVKKLKRTVAEKLISVDPQPAAAHDSKYQLPQKKLPEFGGDVREWLSFWAAFEQIHKDGGMNEAEKFHYLLQCIKVNSPARRLIESFPVSAKNYSAAVDALTSHYGRDNMLIKVYVRDLLQIVIQNAMDNGKTDLMDLVPKLSSQIRNLEELGVTSDKCEHILYPVVESCLPEDVLLAWQRNANFDEKLKPLMDFLGNEVTNKLDRTLAQMDFTITTSTTKEDKKSWRKQRRDEQVKDIPAAAALMNVGGDKAKKTQKCQFCDGQHETHTCGKAKLKMTLDERKATVKEKGLCFKCLRSGHRSDKCRTFVVCSICLGKHYEMMCSGKNKDNEPAPQPTNMMMAAVTSEQQQLQGGFTGYQQQPQQMMSVPVNHSTTRSQKQWSTQNLQDKAGDSCNDFSNVSAGRKRVSLHTLLAIMDTPTGRFTVRIFIDGGSDESYILQELAERTKLKRVGRQTLQHQVFRGVLTDDIDHPLYEVTLRGIDGNGCGTFIFNGTDRIAQAIRKPDVGVWMNQLVRRGIILHDQSRASEDVQLLIGMDVAAQIWTGGFHRLSPYDFVKETIFGWVFGGSRQAINSSNLTTSNMVTTMMMTHATPEELWSLEVLGIQDEPAKQTKQDMELAAVQHFKNTVKRIENGRYEVELPWISGHSKLLNNFSQAKARLHALTKDLMNENYLEDYHRIIVGWESDGIVEGVSDPYSTNTGFYMPHRHVVKTSSSTTPLRPVFNASAKARGSPSLNDCLERGPNLLELIPGIMLRFRKYQVGLISDIKKTFLQISVSEQHRDFLRFIWWKDTTCSEMKIYRHKRVVFGVKSSPFLLAATLKHHIEDTAEDSDFSNKLLQSFYVDNSVTSHASLQEAEHFQRTSKEMLLPACFDLRGWEYGPASVEKPVSVLGMTWFTGSDTLSLCLDSTLEKINGPLTKRGLLSMVNSIFDPMGFVCPFTLIPKLLFQKACLADLKWDEPLPEDIVMPLSKWKGQVQVLSDMKLPRWMSNSNSEEGLSIHCFCDGSSKAYATCLYLRSESADNVSVQLMMAKSRVAPTKVKLTIPRMELMACLIGVRLTRDAVNALGYETVPVFYWTDSTTALAWVRNDKEWGRFVSGRVEEIRKLSHPLQWNHVPGEVNPADLPSRGCSAVYLLESKWWEGPEWLSENKNSWPQPLTGIYPCPSDALEELKKKVVSSQVITQDPDILFVLSRRSDWNKVLRTVALIHRYFDRLKRRLNRRSQSALELTDKIPSSWHISLEEFQRAERCVLRAVQQSAFNGVEDRTLSKLSPFKDENGLIRIKTQLLFGEDKFEMRCPIVLPHKYELVRLIIRNEHEENSHAGVQTLQALLRERYWILRSRRTISNVVHSCTSCRRFLAKKCVVPGAPLPPDRIRDTVSFDITGVDLAGPLFLRGNEKVWVVLYTDAVYRGVHLEITNTLSTEGFLRTFRRFIARRGRPSTVYSDNGLNFVGANNAFREIDWNEVEKFATVKRINWRFNPPTAAWWGGFWERLVGMMKTLLRRVLGKKVVDLEELQTLLCDVESTMNRRPLTFMSDESGELQPLCPINFMRDNPSALLPEADALDHNSLKKRARYCQKLREELRSRFRKEYLGQLEHHAGQKEISVLPGDVVLVEYDNKKRIDWPLGVVTEVYPGRDGKIRSALVKTRDGSFPRPLPRLFILESVKKEVVQPDAEETEKEVEKIQRTRAGRIVKQPDRLRFK